MKDKKPIPVTAYLAIIWIIIGVLIGLKDKYLIAWMAFAGVVYVYYLWLRNKHRTQDNDARNTHN